MNLNPFWKSLKRFPLKNTDSRFDCETPWPLEFVPYQDRHQQPFLGVLPPQLDMLTALLYRSLNPRWRLQLWADICLDEVFTVHFLLGMRVLLLSTKIRWQVPWQSLCKGTSFGFHLKECMGSSLFPLPRVLKLSWPAKCTWFSQRTIHLYSSHEYSKWLNPCHEERGSNTYDFGSLLKDLWYCAV